mgnify:CR=1 FL=1
MRRRRVSGTSRAFTTGRPGSHAAAVAGWQVKPIPSLAGTDARLWRERGVPAFSYGTTAANVAMRDEHTDIDEWQKVVRVHALSALDYLTGEEDA